MRFLAPLLFFLLSFNACALSRNVMCVGDSITVGTGATTGGYLWGLKSKEVTINFVGAYGSYPVKNCGVNGTYTANVLAGIDGWLDLYLPSGTANAWIVIHIGTNDVYDFTNPFAASVQNVHDTLDKIFAHDSNIKVVCCLIAPLANASDSKVTQYNTALNTMLSAYGNVNLRIADVNTAMKANANWATEYFTYDTTHPNDTGDYVIATEMYSHFDAIPADVPGVTVSRDVVLNGVIL